MQITFKSEEHRKAFARIAKCNEWIARTLGMDTWECREEPADEYDKTPVLAVLDGFDNQVTGVFEYDGGRCGVFEYDGGQCEDHAWIFWGERKYFDIVE
jgi:hypothetical protein